MKTYQQMAFEVLKARDAYQLRQQHRITGFKIACPVALSFSFVVLVGVHFWQDSQNLPQIQTIKDTPVIETEKISESSTESQTFNILEIPETLPENTTENFSAEMPEPVTESSEILKNSSVTEAVQERIFIQETEVQETQIIIIDEPEISEPESPEPDTFSPETVPATEIVTELIQEEVFSEMPEQISTDTGTEILQKVFLHMPKMTNSYGEDDGTEVSEIPFFATGKTISAEEVGEWFDTVDVTIFYPDGTSQMMEHLGEAYFVKGVSDGHFAAVQFIGDETYYLFQRQDETEQ